MVHSEIKTWLFHFSFMIFPPIIKQENIVAKKAWKEIYRKQILQNNLPSTVSPDLGKRDPWVGSDKWSQKLKDPRQGVRG